METLELFYPQIAARAGPYTFDKGIEIEVYSSKSSYFDWAKIRFTEQFQPKISLARKDPAAIELGYNNVFEEVFTGYVSKPYNGGGFTDEVTLKDKTYIFEYGVNIIALTRSGGSWELETVSAPFVRHSHKISVKHPKVSGEFEVSKVVSSTSENGFIRTKIYF